MFSLHRKLGVGHVSDKDQGRVYTVLLCASPMAFAFEFCGTADLWHSDHLRLHSRDTIYLVDESLSIDMRHTSVPALHFSLSDSL